MINDGSFHAVIKIYTANLKKHIVYQDLLYLRLYCLHTFIMPTLELDEFQ